MEYSNIKDAMKLRNIPKMKQVESVIVSLVMSAAKTADENYSMGTKNFSEKGCACDCCYIQAGDLKIDSRNNHNVDFFFPLEHYHGI